MRFWFKLALFLLLPLSAQADVRLIAREYLNNRPTVTTTHWFGLDKSARDDGRTRTVMRFDLGRMYIIDRQERTYRSLELPKATPLKVIVVPTPDAQKIGNWMLRSLLE